MKKYFTIIFSLAFLFTTINLASAKTTSNASLASAIKMYKARNYSECYVTLSEIIKHDPSNAVAYYYLAITSAQIGKKDEAINNYNKVLELAPSGKLGSYAFRGKTCIETPEKCHVDDSTELDNFVHSKYGNGFSTEARSEYEKQKIENFMREMNRHDDISPSRFKEYKDFSSEVPTNDEIVAAFRTIQRAGLSDYLGNSYSDVSFLMNGQNTNPNATMLNMLMGESNSSLSPQLIQSLLTNQMSASF